MQHAVSILRVSTKKQLSEGEGIENQRRGNDEYIQKKRYRMYKEYVIAETADDKERADFEAVLDTLVEHKRDIDVVVFWKMDRISRGGVGNYYALKSYLAKHGLRIEFATEQIDTSPAGELMESMLAATARFENRLRVDRTIGTERILTREGYWCRAAPTCFKNGRDSNGKPILLPDGQWGLLRYGLLKQMTGAHKLSEVAAELKGKGLVTHKGNPLSKQMWEKICRNPLYGGLICEKWTEHKYVRAKFEGPLSPEEWRRLQEVLNSRGTVARRLPRQKCHQEFPLRRFLRCPRCGERVRGYAAVKRNGKRYPYYDCDNSACKFRVPVATAHGLFVDLLRDITPSPKLLELFRETVLQVWEEHYQELSNQTDGLHETVAKLRAERRSLIELMKRSCSSPALLTELQKDFGRVEKELALATMERNTSEVEELEAEAVVNTCIDFLKRASELWQEWPADLQNRIQAMVFPQGVSYGVLEGQSNPQLSLVYAVLEDLKMMAAPRCRVTNHLIQVMIEWYNQLRGLPLALNSWRM